MRAQQDGGELKKGDWGLVRCNDPDFSWSIPPFPDPLEGLDDDEVDKATVEEKERSLEFYSAVEVFEVALKSDPELGYDLVSSAMKAGYDRQKHGRFSFWLFDHLGRWTITHQPIHHSDARLEASYADE